MKENKTRVLVLSLVLIIVVLLGFVMYSFVVRPAITGYATNAYNGGVQDAVTSIMRQASQCQQIPLTSGETTMNLIWVDCLQQSAE